MRAYVLTLDALFAITMLFLAVILIGTEWFRPLASDGLYLKQVSLDASYLLEKTNRLDMLLDGNISAVREVFELLPRQVCVQLAVKTAGSDAVMANVTRFDCYNRSGELQTTFGLFIYNNVSYKSELQSWYKG